MSNSRSNWLELGFGVISLALLFLQEPTDAANSKREVWLHQDSRPWLQICTTELITKLGTKVGAADSKTADATQLLGKRYLKQQLAGDSGTETSSEKSTDPWFALIQQESERLKAIHPNKAITAESATEPQLDHFAEELAQRSPSALATQLHQAMSPEEAEISRGVALRSLDLFYRSRRSSQILDTEDLEQLLLARALFAHLSLSTLSHEELIPYRRILPKLVEDAGRIEALAASSPSDKAPIQNYRSYWLATLGMARLTILQSASLSSLSGIDEATAKTAEAFCSTLTQAKTGNSTEPLELSPLFWGLVGLPDLLVNERSHGADSTSDSK